ncbi:hypothetical protein EYF80_056771 [Liparis tanakae]|uniref:Uncharacterized protein n=1 Tax=Liparis tanakae TaxID=230148 RepID=A0A4Z2EW00_9TELE|nr:hypothetical protein EYF80_056771 [Liparis tanakae]
MRDDLTFGWRGQSHPRSLSATAPHGSMITLFTEGDSTQQAPPLLPPLRFDRLSPAPSQVAAFLGEPFSNKGIQAQKTLKSRLADLSGRTRFLPVSAFGAATRKLSAFW